MLCDERCVDLARTFLEDGSPWLATQDNIAALAVLIQQTIEDYIGAAEQEG